MWPGQKQAATAPLLRRAGDKKTFGILPELSVKLHAGFPRCVTAAIHWLPLVRIKFVHVRLARGGDADVFGFVEKDRVIEPVFEQRAALSAAIRSAIARS